MTTQLMTTGETVKRKLPLGCVKGPDYIHCPYCAGCQNRLVRADGLKPPYYYPRTICLFCEGEFEERKYA